MATADNQIGRMEAIGLGIESTPGVAVAPQIYVRWYDNGFQSKTNVVENESAMGVVDEISDSEVTSDWMEGAIGGKNADQAIGFLMTGFFGLPTTGAAESGVYPHTFRMGQSSVPRTLTIVRSNPLETLAYPYGTVDTLEFSSEADDWVMFSSALKARSGAPTTATPAFIDETEFTSKHISVKLAANVAGLSSAPNLKAVSAKLNLERPSEPFNPLGTGSTPEFDRGAFTVTGELVIRYTDTQYEADFLNNVAKAMEVKLQNGNRSLTFTLPQVRTRELERSGDRNEVVTQTLNLKGEYSLSAGYSVEAVLRNTRATYEAAS
ncbi:phage tail tube protein [Dietzia maris]|uniref:phage tail tube protein n=1 Tax=Dietzia maris TaxID=37915 RepID=UPI0037CA7A5E